MLSWILKVLPTIAALAPKQCDVNPSEKLLYDYAISHAGLPYKWGGDDPIEGYDCSGFVLELMKSANQVPMSIDLTANGLYNLYKDWSVKEPSFGVLAFYGTESRATHVSFCLNEYECIEAGGGGRSVDSAQAASRDNAYVRVRPVKYRKDLIGYRHPPYHWRKL